MDEAATCSFFSVFIPFVVALFSASMPLVESVAVPRSTATSLLAAIHGKFTAIWVLGLRQNLSAHLAIRTIRALQAEIAQSVHDDRVFILFQ